MNDLTKDYVCGYMDQYETWHQDDNYLAYDERIVTEMWDVGRGLIERSEFITYLRDHKLNKHLTVIIYVAISR